MRTRRTLGQGLQAAAAFVLCSSACGAPVTTRSATPVPKDVVVSSANAQECAAANNAAPPLLDQEKTTLRAPAPGARETADRLLDAWQTGKVTFIWSSLHPVLQEELNPTGWAANVQTIANTDCPGSRFRSILDEEINPDFGSDEASQSAILVSYDQPSTYGARIIDFTLLWVDGKWLLRKFQSYHRDLPTPEPSADPSNVPGAAGESLGLDATCDEYLGTTVANRVATTREALIKRDVSASPQTVINWEVSVWSACTINYQYGDDGRTPYDFTDPNSYMPVDPILGTAQPK